MYKLVKWLFPNTPRLVRDRKFRLLLFTIFLTLSAVAAVALLFYLGYLYAGVAAH